MNELHSAHIYKNPVLPQTAQQQVHHKTFHEVFFSCYKACILMQKLNISMDSTSTVNQSVLLTSECSSIAIVSGLKLIKLN